MKLDRIDHEILRCLQNDARQSNKELASSVGLAPSSCLERVRRLRDGGVLRSFRADVDPAALGVGIQAMVALRVRQHSRELYSTLREHLLSLPEVIGLFDMAGADDFLVHVVARDTKHLRSLAWDQFSTRPEVAHVETALIFDYTRAAALPDFAAKES